MKKTIVGLILIINVSINIFSQNTKPENDEKEIIFLAVELNKARINWDASILERIISNEYKEYDDLYQQTDNTKTQVITKSTLIQMYKSPPPPGERLVSYTPSNIRLRFYGDTAILTEYQVWKIKNSKGKIEEDGGSFFMVAIKRDSNWKIVFFGEIPDFNYTIPKPKPAKSRPTKPKNE